MKRYKVVCDINSGSIFFQTVIWVVLSVSTFGLILPFFAYYFVKIILNHTEIHEF
ncbi:MAG: DUF6693 family protein [Nitrospinota bacterium]